MVDDDIQVSPSVKLSYPVADCRERCDNKKGSDNSIVKYGLKKGYTLDCLAQAHLISEDTILPTIMAQNPH